jgi:hypothetical protein
MHSADNDVVIAALMHGFNQATQMRERTGQKRHTAIAQPHWHTCEPIIRITTKLLDNPLLLARQQVHRERALRLDCGAGRARSRDAEQEQARIE